MRVELRGVEDNFPGVDAYAVDILEMGLDIGEKPADAVDTQHDSKLYQICMMAIRSHPAQTILPFGPNKEEREFWERLSCYSVAISHQFVGLGIFGSFDIFGIICCLGEGGVCTII